MNRYTIIKVFAAVLAILLLASGCTAKNNPASGSGENVAVSNPTTAAATVTPTATAAATTAAASAAAAASSAPAATAKPSSSDAFKLYKLIDIGMTKDAVDKKLGVAPEAATGKNDPPNSYYYVGADSNGVYVQYGKDLKLTNKTVQYKDAAAALTPYTGKPVTQDECDKITDGMPHADVVKLLGSEGAECSKTQSVVFGKTSVGTIFRWGNADGSFLQVVFTSSDTAHMAMFFAHD